MENTFRKGVHPASRKELTKDLPIERMAEPSLVHIPLSMHIGKSAVCVVKEGDQVKKGQLIGQADGFVSANVFSSVCGKVVKVGEIRETVMGKCAHVVIEPDGQDEEFRFEKLTEPTRGQILQRITDCGIVGMGGAGFPTHVKLAPKTKVDTFIINGAECEPYITCDHRIMLEHTSKLIGGALFMAKAIGVDEVYFGIEENKPNAIAQMQAYCETHQIKNVKVVSLKAKYPQGAEKQLIYAIKKRKVPAGGLPADVGCIVDNVHTALSVYEAVAEGKTLYERITTVTGDAVATPRNLIVPIGTLYKDVIDYCGGFVNAIKLISGGPMMGIAVYNGECATTKTTSCLLALSENSASIEEVGPCINCSKCAKVCPMRLMPMFIDSALAVGNVDDTIKYGVLSCIECGCCSYECPAKRPLVQAMKLAKKKIRERKQNG